MTRFARARGSKSENSRVPEQATPWHELQAQLEDAQHRRDETEAQLQAEQRRKENYEKFLKEHKEAAVQKSWCEFDVRDKSPQKVTAPAVMSKNALKKLAKREAKAKNGDFIITDVQQKAPKHDKPPKVLEKSTETSQVSEEEMEADNEELTKWCDEESDKEIEDEYNDLTSKLEDILKKEENQKAKKKKEGKTAKSDCSKSENNTNSKDSKKSKKHKISEDVSTKLQPHSEHDDIGKSKNETSKTKKQKVSNTQFDVAEVNIPSNNENKKSKKRKISTVESNVLPENCDTPVITELNLISESQPSKKKKKKQKTTDKSETLDDVSKNSKSTSAAESVNSAEISTKVQKKNKANKIEISEAKVQNNRKENKKQEHTRRKPLNDDKSVLIIDGEELEVTVYGGFPILSRDANRLIQLRKDLVSKGIPKSEVDRTMKLERRKAEKALARIKKKLCFHCRKGGHNLSECPELNKKSENTGIPSSGICFKCGSTEHTHFACRVVKTQDFKFAQCFICNEQGHISRQCPDNPRGLYPKGGGCRECGDVTHLKKDCPKILQQREDSTMKLDTIETSNIEDISQKPSGPKITVPKVKHVKF